MGAYPPPPPTPPDDDPGYTGLAPTTRRRHVPEEPPDSPIKSYRMGDPPPPPRRRHVPEEKPEPFSSGEVYGSSEEGSRLLLYWLGGWVFAVIGLVLLVLQP